METSSADKRPFEVEEAFAKLREVMQEYPKAGLFQLADEGYTKPFELLIACILSIRTLDEVMIPAARRLLDAARTPAAVAGLSIEEIDTLIRPCVFHAAKSVQICTLAEQIVANHRGDLPCDEATLLALPGVGPKCGNLTLGIGCGQPRIGVDIHVHRVVNRWGYAAASTPELTLAALEQKLPRALWIETNRLLMPFGKFICTGKAPHCSTCPVVEMCRQVGVTAHR